MLKLQAVIYITSVFLIGPSFYFSFRWFAQWGIKMESERKQRQRKREQIGHTIEEEMLPLEHTERRGNKTVTIINLTPCAYVSDLKDHIVSFVHDGDS